MNEQSIECSNGVRITCAPHILTIWPMSGAKTSTAVFQPEQARAIAEGVCPTLLAELERERMCHAACGVIAMSNTPETLARNRDMHADYLSGSVQDCIKAAEREIALRKAIEEHRDQKADDRCWLDDLKLYAAAGLHVADNTISDPAAMLENCKRFIACRMARGEWATYQELEARIKELTEALDREMLEANQSAEKALVLIEEARKERDEALARARWIEKATAAEDARRLASALPPDILMHPLPFPDRLDYAGKLIQAAFERWSKKQ